MPRVGFQRAGEAAIGVQGEAALRRQLKSSVGSTPTTAARLAEEAARSSCFAADVEDALARGIKVRASRSHFQSERHSASTQMPKKSKGPSPGAQTFKSPFQSGSGLGGGEKRGAARGREICSDLRAQALFQLPLSQQAITVAPGSQGLGQQRRAGPRQARGLRGARIGFCAVAWGFTARKVTKFSGGIGRSRQ